MFYCESPFLSLSPAHNRPPCGWDQSGRHSQQPSLIGWRCTFHVSDNCIWWSFTLFIFFSLSPPLSLSPSFSLPPSLSLSLSLSIPLSLTLSLSFRVPGIDSSRTMTWSRWSDRMLSELSLMYSSLNKKKYSEHGVHVHVHVHIYAFSLHKYRMVTTDGVNRLYRTTFQYEALKRYYTTIVCVLPHSALLVHTRNFTCTFTYTHTHPDTLCWTSCSATLVSMRTLAIVRACMSYWPLFSLSFMLRWETLMTTP